MSPLVINKSSASQLSSLLGRPPLLKQSMVMRSSSAKEPCKSYQTRDDSQSEGRPALVRPTQLSVTSSRPKAQPAFCNTLFTISCVLYCERTTAVCNTMDCVVEGEQDCDIRSPPPGQSTHHSKPTTAFLRALTMVTTLAMGTSIIYRQC